MWGLGLSVVLTGALLLAAPFSPVRFALRVLDGRPDVRAVQVHLRPGAAGGPSHGWTRVVPELGAELSREWTRAAPRLGAELAREWTRMAPELREEMRRELRRELRGLAIEVEGAPPGFRGGS